MSLKNVLIIVDNIDESIDFYEELFGLRVITRLEGITSVVGVLLTLASTTRVMSM